MATFGIIEIISLLLSLAGFGIQTNPKAPTADQALEYAVPDADLVMHFDVGSVVPGNYRVLSQLVDQPQIKASPELTKMVRQALNEIEGARGLAKSATGIDLANDVNDGTVFVQFVPQQSNPNVVLAAHGKFSSITIDKIASMTHKTAQKVGGGALVDVESDTSVAVTKTGTLLVGSPNLIKARLADSWRAPSRTAGSNISYVAEVLAQKPVYALILTMSANARKEAIAKLGGTQPNFATDVIQRHKVAAFSLYQNGIGWTWIDTKAGGIEQMGLMSEGVAEFLRAAQIAPRAMAKIIIGGLESYRGTDKRIDEALRQKASLMKIVETYSGDGNFKTQIDKDPKTMRLTARLTGKSVSEVIPFSMALPALAATVLMRGTTKAPAPYPTPAVAPPARPAPMPKPTGTGLSK